MKRRPLADDRVPMLERNGRLRELLEAGDLEPWLSSQADLEGAGEERLAGVRRRGSFRCDELLEDARLRAVAEGDERPGQERSVGGADGPADDDRSGESDTGRDIEDDSLGPQRTG